MSPEKTLITHARTQKAKFLGHAISVYQVDDKITPRSTDPRIKRRSINGHVRLGIPYGLVTELAQQYERNGAIIGEYALLPFSDANIIEVYQQRFRGLANYYKYAVDRCHLSKLKHVMERPIKTLAQKYRISVSQVYEKYRGS
jgi:hypothetical protein